MVIVTGFAQGLNLVLCAPGPQRGPAGRPRGPGYADTAPAIAALTGVEAIRVPVDECGIDVSALARTRARAVVLTPAHQWPTGAGAGPAAAPGMVGAGPAREPFRTLRRFGEVGTAGLRRLLIPRRPGCAHPAHLNVRDTTLAFASRAPPGRDPGPEEAQGLAADPWYTITDDFDKDFGVDEWHGTNAFVRDGERIYRDLLRRQPGRRGDGKHLELPRYHGARPSGGSGRTRRRAIRRPHRTRGGTTTTRTARPRDRGSAGCRCDFSSEFRGVFVHLRDDVGEDHRVRTAV